jgi:hypothetical protein
MPYEESTTELLDRVQFRRRFWGVPVRYSPGPEPTSQRNYQVFRKAVELSERHSRTGLEKDIFELAKETGVNEELAVAFAKAAERRKWRDNVAMLGATALFVYCSNSDSDSALNTAGYLTSFGLMAYFSFDFLRTSVAKWLFVPEMLRSKPSSRN